MATGKLTQLDAVNQLLSAIGQLPVNSITDNVSVDVTKALATLSRVSGEVQEKGWKFNTETTYKVKLNSSKQIIVPDNVVSLEPDGISNTALRGNLLFHTDTSSSTFESDVTGKAVIVLEWDSLPQYARQYIAAVAAREFQMDTVGSDSANQNLLRNEATAWAAFKRREVNYGDYNMLGSNR